MNLRICSSHSDLRDAGETTRTREALPRRWRSAQAAHFVGEHGAAGEGEVEHAVALIGIERHEGDLGRFGAANDGLLVVAPEGDAFVGEAAAFQPWRNDEGDAHGVAMERGENAEGVFGGDVGRQRAVFGEQGLGFGGQAFAISADDERREGGMAHDFRAGRSLFHGILPNFAMAFLELPEDGFDVLAGVEAVDAEVHAGAGELTPGDVVDLNGVGLPAHRGDAEVGEDGELWCEVGDLHGFLAGAEATAIDFVFVGGAPVAVGGELDFVGSAGFLGLRAVRHRGGLFAEEMVEF